MEIYLKQENPCGLYQDVSLPRFMNKTTNAVLACDLLNGFIYGKG